jgi:hypothetical protein
VPKMMKAAALLLIGAVIGAALGAAAVFRIAAPQQAMNSYLVAEGLETQSYLRFRFGTADSAAKSLDVYVDLLQREAERLRQVQPNWFHQRLGTAYGRRALIAERSGDPVARDRFLDLARMQFAIAGSKVNTEEVREIVRAADAAWDRDLKTPAHAPASRPAAP